MLNTFSAKFIHAVALICLPSIIFAQAEEKVWAFSIFGGYGTAKPMEYTVQSANCHTAALSATFRSHTRLSIARQDLFQSSLSLDQGGEIGKVNHRRYDYALQVGMAQRRFIKIKNFEFWAGGGFARVSSQVIYPGYFVFLDFDEGGKPRGKTLDVSDLRVFICPLLTAGFEYKITPRLSGILQSSLFCMKRRPWQAATSIGLGYNFLRL